MINERLKVTGSLNFGTDAKPGGLVQSPVLSEETDCINSYCCSRKYISEYLVGLRLIVLVGTQGSQQY